MKNRKLDRCNMKNIFLIQFYWSILASSWSFEISFCIWVHDSTIRITKDQMRGWTVNTPQGKQHWTAHISLMFQNNRYFLTKFILYCINIGLHAFNELPPHLQHFRTALSRWPNNEDTHNLLQININLFPRINCLKLIFKSTYIYLH